MVGFLFGGETGETPETLKRKRQIAEALIVNKTPQNVGEGLQSIGNAILYRKMMGDIGAKEKAGLASADAAWANAFGGGTAQPTPGTMGGSMPEVTDTGEIPVKPIDMTGNEVFSSFMDTVKAGGVTNPNALAAIAATGQRESGFDPKNAVRTWSDPSESGQAGRAGGIMSWRGPRYEALAATGDLSPAGQAKFFLGENPQLIQRLNAAKTPEEAQRLMNEAWKFAGWNRPGGEAAARFKAANAFLPQFAGQQGDAAQAIEAIAPTGDVSLTDEVADFRNSPEFLKAYPGGYNKQPLSDQQFNDRFGDTALPAEMPKDRGALVSALMANQGGGQNQMVTPELPTEFAGSGQLQGAMANPRAGIVQALMEGQPASSDQIAQARAVGTQQQQTGQGPLGLDPRILDALNNPFLSDGRKAVLKAMIEQQMGQQQAEREMHLKQADPAYQVGLEKSRLELDNLRNPRTSEMQNLEYRAKQAGLEPGTKAYSDFMISGGKGDGVSVTVNNGEPGDGALRKKLDEKTGERWSTLQELGTTSAANAQDFQVLDELIKVAPQGPIQGRLAELFPGVSTAGAAFQSIVKRIAPTLRAPGSGATSDIEYDGMLKSLPALSNKPEANALINGIMKAKSAINVERSNVIDAYSRGEISAGEARSRIAEIDKRSIMTPDMKKMLDGLSEESTGKGARITPGTVEEGYRFKGGDPADPSNWEQEM